MQAGSERQKRGKENIAMRNVLESDDKMALGRHGVGFFSVSCKVVVAP
jgi:hypothetical protein